MNNKTLIAIIIGTTTFSTAVWGATECASEEENCWGCGTNCVARLDGGNFSISLVGDAKTATMTDYEDYRNVPGISQKSSITSVTIDEGIQNIGRDTLSDTTSLTSITIPSSVTSIGRSAFYGATSLESVNFGDNSKLETIGYGAFYGNTALTGIDIPDSVTEIGEFAFQDATSLESVNFGPNSKLETIGKGAFYGNTALTGIDIPDSVTEIGEGAFYYATSLESVNFGPNSKLETIGGLAFCYATSLESIDIPDTVTSILGKYVFYGTGVTELFLPESLFADDATGINPIALAGTNIKIYCPEGNQKCLSYETPICSETVLQPCVSLQRKGNFTFDTYTKESDGRYVLDGVRYKSFADMQKGQNGLGLKRIYTIEEANAVAGTKNRVSITYR